MLRPILFALSLLHSSALPAPWHKSFWKPLLGLSCIFSCASDSLQECRKRFQNQQFQLGEFIGRGDETKVGKIKGTDLVSKTALDFNRSEWDDNLYKFNRMTEIYGLNKPVCFIRPESESDNFAVVYHEIIPLNKLPHEILLPYVDDIRHVITSLQEWQYQREGLRMPDVDHIFALDNVGVSFAGDPILYDLDHAFWDTKWKFDAQKETEAARKLNTALRNPEWQEFLEKVRKHKKLEKWETSGRFKKFNLF